MPFERLNRYRIMWVFVYFDLPTETKKDRKIASDFRKNLLKDGFNMMQFSVYVRHCASKENAEVHKERVRDFMPEKGSVIMFEITDVQFGKLEILNGYKRRTKRQANPQQLELF